MSVSFSSAVNPLYRQRKIQEQMRAHYRAGGNLIYLPDFFTSEAYAVLSRDLQKVKGSHERVADRFSYTPLHFKALWRFFSSREFALWIQTLTGAKVNKVTITIRRYGHRDYRLLHDGEQTGARLEFCFLFLKRWDAHWGGHLSYVDEERKPRLLPLQGNGLLLIDKPRTTGSFVQYINHHAGNNVFVLVEGSIE